MSPAPEADQIHEDVFPVARSVLQRQPRGAHYTKVRRIYCVGGVGGEGVRKNFYFLAALQIRIRILIRPIRMFLGLLDPDPDPLIRGMDPDPEPSIIKPK